MDIAAQPFTTTLNAVRKCRPDTARWKELLSCPTKSDADDAPLSLLSVLDSSGLSNALWCLRAVDGHDDDMRLFAFWCARQVQHLMDERSVTALDVAERSNRGEVDDSRLRAEASAIVHKPGTSQAVHSACHAASAAANDANAAEAAFHTAIHAAYAVRVGSFAVDFCDSIAGDIAYRFRQMLQDGAFIGSTYS